MRVLVTNDDGVGSSGISALARSLVDDGHDVVVAAPVEDRSGSSAALGPVHTGQAISVVTPELAQLEHTPAYGVDGPPALAVMAACLGAFGEPFDLVASGINHGSNTGRSVLHSGTVGAALTAANLGLSAAAISIQAGDLSRLDVAGRVAAAAVRWLGDSPGRTVLNLNVPDCDQERLRGVRWAPLAQFGSVRAALAESPDGTLEMELRSTEAELDPETDTALVRAGWVTVTALNGPRASDPLDAPEAIARALAGRSSHEDSIRLDT
jgi:5'-nucleotidase